jgi:UDP:flavonoid glycosyltransferase YjiC (YdhE family)
MKRILVSPVSVGLGHATRDLPIIRDFLARGHHVTIAAQGRALRLLRHEVPQCEFIPFKDYPWPLTKTRHFIALFLAMGPWLQGAINAERRRFQRLLARRRFDLILSDHRYGIYAPDIPSFVICSLLYFMPPVRLRWRSFSPPLGHIEFFLEMYNARTFSRFDRIIIPDYEDPENNLSGRMTHDLLRFRPEQLYYAGVLSSIRRQDGPQDVDVFITISGVEPQQSQLERLVLEQVERLPGRRIAVTLGRPEKRHLRQVGDRISVYGYLGRDEQQAMLNRAHLVVCRSSYTTIMELAELGKKALLIPHPGHPEQEYLAALYERRGWFHSVRQEDLDLVRDVGLARARPGFPFGADTQAGVARLYRDLFAPILDA